VSGGDAVGADEGRRVWQFDDVEVGRVAIVAAVRSDLAAVAAGV
jgi:hypothetical protein